MAGRRMTGIQQPVYKAVCRGPALLSAFPTAWRKPFFHSRGIGHPWDRRRCKAPLRTAGIAWAIRMILARLLFDIGFQRIALLFQQLPHRRWAGWVFGLTQAATQLAQTAAHPLLALRGITGRFGGYDLLQNGFYRRVFFSTGRRPPPGRRTRPVGRSASEASSSRRPRRIVFSSMPVIWGLTYASYHLRYVSAG